MSWLARLACRLLPLAVVAAGAAHAAEPLTIGLNLGQTGALAPNGKAALLAMQIWVEDTNAKGGLLGRPVKLITYDDQSNPALVPGIISKLLDVDHVDILIAGNGTNMVAPALPVAMQHHRTLTGLFGLDVNSEFHYPNYFSIIPAGGEHPKEAFSAGFFAMAAAANPRPKTIALVGADAEFARNAVDGARAQAKRDGYKIVYDNTYPPTTADYTPIIRAIQATNPDIVFVGSYPPDTVGMIRAANEVGLNVKMFGGGMVGLQATAIKTQLGPLLNGIVNFDFWLPVARLQHAGGQGVPAEIPVPRRRQRRRCAGLLPAAVRLCRSAGHRRGGRGHARHRPGETGRLHALPHLPHAGGRHQVRPQRRVGRTARAGGPVPRHKRPRRRAVPRHGYANRAVSARIEDRRPAVSLHGGPVAAVDPKVRLRACQPG